MSAADFNVQRKGPHHRSPFKVRLHPRETRDWGFCRRPVGLLRMAHVWPRLAAISLDASDSGGWLCLDQGQQRRKKGETRRRSQPRLSFNPPRPSSMRDRGTKMNKLNCIRLACVLACFSPCLDETKYGYPYRQPVLRRSRWYPKQDSQIALRARSIACCCLCQHRRCSAHFPSPQPS